MKALILGSALGILVVALWQILQNIRAEVMLRRADRARAIRLRNESLRRGEIWR